MIKKYLFLLFITISIHSQTFQWVDFPTVNYSIGQTNGYPTCCDNLGNVYFVGIKDNQFNSSNIYGNLFYRKYNSSGSLLYEKIIGGKVRSFNLKSDSLGNIYLVAAFKTSISFDSGAAINTSETSEVPILIKFDSNGTFLWNVTISNIGSFNHFNAIDIDSNNDIYIGIDNFNNSRIVKLSATNGSVLSSILQQNVQIISSVSVDNLGNIYASGSCGKTTSTFAGVAQPTSLSYSIYAVKYNSLGVHQWTKYIENISCLDPEISVKSPNDVYLSSSLSGAFSFGSLTSQGPPSGFSDDIFITKLDANGNFQWVREVDGNGKASVGNGHFLTSDNSGNVYFAGNTKSTTVWSPSFTTTVTGFGSDALFLKYNSNGDLQIVKKAGGNSSDTFESIALDNLGTIYITGKATNTVSFDGITNTVGSNVPFISKISSTLNNNSFTNENFIVYPNPSNNEFYISNVSEKTKGEIYDAVGKKIKSFEVDSLTPININEIASGIYFIKLANNRVRKFIKQ